jgi:hypothetical protein
MFRSVTLSLTVAWAVTLPGLAVAAPLTPSPFVDRLESRLLGDPEDEGWTRCRPLLQELAGTLDWLPLETLSSVRLEGDALELRFDFGGAGRKKFRVPDRTLHVWNERRGRVERMTVEGCKVRMRDRVVLYLDGGDVRGVRKGDLEACVGFLSPDIELRTETREPATVLDEEGRPVVEVDEDGGVVREEDGSPRLVRARRWLVLEAAGRSKEIALLGR